MATKEHKADPLEGFQSENRGAAIWFVCAILFGGFLTYKLSRIDRMNYDTKGKYLNYTEYKENRLATTSLGSETKDPRASSLLSTKIK